MNGGGVVCVDKKQMGSCLRERTGVSRPLQIDEHCGEQLSVVGVVRQQEVPGGPSVVDGTQRQNNSRTRQDDDAEYFTLRARKEAL
ncbi:hypothetical protein NDU88_010161 [Pleurodeles waltl]|uniref:Uncharacterized protein n=1 Tax=Pleurodeles waltl TaxID=8319 RepID=A0AAV7PX93_PLEWA|nr:hypothetical protein NDU88_010161 [Pleurodeles waltl]